MNTLLADPPPSGLGEPPVAEPPQDTRPTDAPESPLPERHCTNCGALMDSSQHWCLACGKGAPDSLEKTPSWRSATAIFGAVAILVLGAGAAAYAALNKSSPKKVVAAKVAPVAAAPATAPPATTTTPPPASSTGAPAPGSGTAAGSSAPTTPPVKAGGFPSTSAPPALPPVSSTPKAEGEPVSETPAPEEKSATESNTGSEGASSSEKESSGASGTAGGSGAEQLHPIVLGANAASTYNPYNYPASTFGDPHLAIDGDATTAWTAAVNPATAPKMAEGLVIDLKGKKTISKLTIVSATPGMTVLIFGTNAKKLPNTITNKKAWTRLSGSHVIKQRKSSIKLMHTNKQFKNLLVWIPKAPEGFVGTPEAPALVELNELVLEAPKQ